jgi:hypothetical protein
MLMPSRIGSSGEEEFRRAAAAAAREHVSDRVASATIEDLFRKAPRKRHADSEPSAAAAGSDAAVAKPKKTHVETAEPKPRIDKDLRHVLDVLSGAIAPGEKRKKKKKAVEADAAAAAAAGQGTSVGLVK